MGMENCYQLSSTISTTTTTTTVAAVTHYHHHHICYFQNKKLNLSKSNLSSSRNSFSSQHHKSNIVCKANDAIHPGLPPSLSVNPDLGFNSVNYTHLENHIPSARLFPAGTSKHWFVQMEKPMDGALTKAQMIDHFVRVLSRVLGNEVDAQMCIYHVSWQSNYGFGCELDEECAEELNGLPGIISVKPDLDFKFVNTDYIAPKIHTPSVDLFPSGNSKHWLVRMEKPMVGVVTKAQMVDHYVNILTKVMGNEVDAQMCIYHVSRQSNFGFCCELDDECARELTDVPGVLSVQLDESFGSISKSYEGDTIQNSAGALDSSKGNETVNVKTKKLFITGLSFYTSEKTLRAAFEGFGELVEVKIIMDKISKRSKGYAFIEYKTEAVAGAALKEMNGKIINGWMIVVDVAKTNPPKYSRGRPMRTN